MNVCILKGSPRKNGNTNSLLVPFAEALKEAGCSCRELDLHTMSLEPCVACRCCQENWHSFNCSRRDDMQQVFDAVLESDLIVLATPIYSWFCTPAMKIALDRLVYGMNKIYSMSPGPRLWGHEQNLQHVPWPQALGGKIGGNGDYLRLQAGEGGGPL